MSSDLVCGRGGHNLGVSTHFFGNFVDGGTKTLGFWVKYEGMKSWVPKNLGNFRGSRGGTISLIFENNSTPTPSQTK